ncbi:hypothetical protein QCA50_010035 [Cerrena zonata]|uniref:Methionyl-tRNA synthetase anticodon-binding domain-containing protein n=1 Tax=Cerrena zonata TaxID=2478898 RepID=A0AAW0G5F9_9APHY
MESVNLRRGLEIAMAISARGNQFLQDNKLDNSLYNNSPNKSDAVVAVGLNLIYLVSAVISPFMPQTRTQISEILNAPPLSITDKFELVLEPGHNIGKAQYLFQRIDEKKVDEWRKLSTPHKKGNRSFGLLAGLSIPPIITKVVLVPSLIQSKYDEIDSIKHDLDYIGWHVRNMEEVKGYKEDDIYVPLYPGLFGV